MACTNTGPVGSWNVKNVWVSIQYFFSQVHDKLPRNAKKEEKIDLSVWKLIKSHIEQGGDKSLILSDDKGDGVEQIIYVTYDDSNAAAATSSSKVGNCKIAQNLRRLRKF